MHTSRSWGGGLVVAALLATATPVHAGITQVTVLPMGFFTGPPSINGDGHYLTFTSSGNLGGLNPVPFGNVFVYEVPTNTFTRITAEGGDDPTITADGRWVAFTSSADYARRNADGSDEIFRCDRVRHRCFQVTRDINGDGASAHPVIGGKGKQVAYETSSNVRRRNPDFSNEVGFYNRGGNNLLSNDPNGDGESLTPAVSADGKFVVFQTTSNLTGRNEDFSPELMLWDVKQRDLSQITSDPDANGESSLPAISGDGRWITFISSSNLGGLNPDGSSAVYLMNRARRSVSVVTTTPDGIFDGDTPTIDDDGRFVAFVAGFNVTGGNADFNPEILLYDRVRKTFDQVTDSTACANLNPKLSGDGTRIAYYSNCDPVGTNADGGFEVFLADNPALNLVVHSEGPVSFDLRDPADNVITPTTNMIPRATYAQGDFDGDTIPEDRVTLAQAPEGTFQITLHADPAAQPTDHVTLDATLNGITVTLADDTVATLDGAPRTFSNQGFMGRTSRMTPLPGVGSKASLTARMRHPPATSGPVRVRFTDGTADAVFDLGNIESFHPYGSMRTFTGTVNGFAITARVAPRPGATTRLTFSAKDGDLSAFGGTGDVSMTIVVQIGADTDMYHWRFKRRVDGSLWLK